MIPRMRTAEATKLAPGIPGATSPTPARNACSAETPMTPRDAARMVAPASWTNFSPRPEASLRENNEIALTSEGAGENKKPANIIGDKELDDTHTSALCELKQVPPSGFSSGAVLANAAWKLVETKSQN